VPVGPDATSSSAPVSSPHTQILLPDPLFIVTRYFRGNRKRDRPHLHCTRLSSTPSPTWSVHRNGRHCLHHLNIPIHREQLPLGYRCCSTKGDINTKAAHLDATISTNMRSVLTLHQQSRDVPMSCKITSPDVLTIYHVYIPWFAASLNTYLFECQEAYSYFRTKSWSRLLKTRMVVVALAWSTPCTNIFCLASSTLHCYKVF
jgi:hypothetical protein